MQPHKHQTVINAWAAGAKIQYKLHPSHRWTRIEDPTWLDNVEYRVEPKEPTAEQLKESLALAEMNLGTLDIAFRENKRLLLSAELSNKELAECKKVQAEIIRGVRAEKNALLESNLEQFAKLQASERLSEFYQTNLVAVTDAYEELESQYVIVAENLQLAKNLAAKNDNVINDLKRTVEEQRQILSARLRKLAVGGCKPSPSGKPQRPPRRP